MKKEIILGLHSIVEAINNSERGEYSLLELKRELLELKKKFKTLIV